MANPALTEKRFETVRDEWQPGWAAPDAAVQTGDASKLPPAATRTGVMTANGTFARTFVLFLLVLVGGAIGWMQTTTSTGDRVDVPGWIWVCIFKPSASPILSPIYAVVEGLFLGSISKAFESQWDGIVFQAVLATIAVFFATL